MGDYIFLMYNLIFTQDSDGVTLVMYGVLGVSLLNFVL